MKSLRDEEKNLPALNYHRYPTPGKLEIKATKPLGNQMDLALAYSPGVAVACTAIAEDPSQVALLTTRQNLVAVVTNGTAVLGLGSVGPLASKPVMEGKAVLFKKFAGIDVFDLELDAKDSEMMIAVVKALEPTFGGINLEDIKAPECFEIERRCAEIMNIPVFHDDQHGTAIIVVAAVLNALRLTKKRLDEVKIVTSGAGAAAIACLDLLVNFGAQRSNIFVTDIDGVVYKGRKELMDQWKAVYAQETSCRTLSEIIKGADIFIGLSVGGVLKARDLKNMKQDPLIMALANPDPEIMPEEARKARPDAIICTGRSDYPNQVNNVLCFPYIFRGALDVGARSINTEMKKAAVTAIAELAHDAPSDAFINDGEIETQGFSRNNLIPSPFDPRLILRIAPAVAKAAMASGVADRPIQDLEQYKNSLEHFVYRSGFIMRPIVEKASEDPKRILYTDGENERVLRAVQTLVQDRLVKPILVGRPRVIASRIKRYGLNLEIGKDLELVDPESDPRYRDYVETYIHRCGRQGITPVLAKMQVRTNTTVIGAIALVRGEADAMICGLERPFNHELQSIRSILGLRPEAEDCAAMSVLLTQNGPYFFSDTHVQVNPTIHQLLTIVECCAEHIESFGIVPKIATISHSNYGNTCMESALKMRKVADLLKERNLGYDVDGELQIMLALNETLRKEYVKDSTLHGSANLLIFPNLDAASAALNAAKALTDALMIGPILIGPAKPAHILDPLVTTRGIINMSVFAVVEAQRNQNQFSSA